MNIRWLTELHMRLKIQLGHKGRVPGGLGGRNKHWGDSLGHELIPWLKEGWTPRLTVFLKLIGKNIFFKNLFY